MTFSSDSRRHVIRSTGVVVAAAMVGRLTGFGREWMVARLLGSNALTDTYYAAFTLPNFLSYLIAGGALGIVFIPVFAQYVAAGREEESWYVFSTVLTVIGLALLGLVLAGELFTYPLAHWIAPGFPPDQQILLVKLIRILLPAQLFLCLGGLLAAVQNAKGRFLAPALAPIVYNFTLIGCAWMLHHRLGITSFAVGVAAGTMVGFFGLPLITFRGLGASFRPNLSIRHPGVKQFFKLSLPIMLALSVDVTDIWIVRWFGSYLSPASITWLMYSRFLVIIPIAIIGQGAGIGSYPFLAQLHAEGKHAERARSLAAGIKSLLLIMLPLSALTVVLSRPLVHLVYTHTRLTQVDTESIASALALFALGMSAKGAQCIISRGFTSAHNTLAPAVIGTLITFLSLPFYWFCARTWQYQGLAAASSIVAVLFAGITMVVLFRRAEARNLNGVLECAAKVSLASFLGALLCHQAVNWLESWMRWQTFSGAFLLLVMVTAVGFPLILLICRLLGVNEVDQYWKRVYLAFPRLAVATRG
jgi:putative peptidoglycan lipid II flippase